MQPQQQTLSVDQIRAFHFEGFAANQVEHFLGLLAEIKACPTTGRTVVDIGGGIGVFAALLRRSKDLSVRVIDSDQESLRVCAQRGDPKIEALLGDALAPTKRGDEQIVCFNLMLHHLVGKSETETRKLQEQAIKCWRGNCEYVFVNEYIYDSYFGNLTGRLIYEITCSKSLSKLATFGARYIPALRANTYGTGVRFRSDAEWRGIFKACGYEIAGYAKNKPERIPWLQRLLLLKEIRRDSYLLRCTLAKLNTEPNPG